MCRVGRPAPRTPDHPGAGQGPPEPLKGDLMSGTQSTGASVVLVHGGFVDGSGWEAVYRILRKDGYKVSIVQNPTISLAEDVRATIRAISAQDGPVVLVGHSYGGGRDHRGRQRPEGGGARLHRRIRSGRG